MKLYFFYTSVRMQYPKNLYFIFCYAIDDKVRFQNNPSVHFRFYWQMKAFRKE
jgi:hypothetical protein